MTTEICIPDSKLPCIVVVGAGFAGISLVKKLKDEPLQVVLIDKNNFHQFQPLLYQVATSDLEPESILFPLRKLFRGYKNVFFRMAEVNNIITVTNTLLTDIGTIKYDYLVIATGSTTNFFGLKDVESNSIGMKTIQEALNIRNLILQNLEKATETCDEKERSSLTNIAIIGGGPAGVETAGSIAEFKKHIIPKDYPELDIKGMSVYLIEAGDRLLQSMSQTASQKALYYLQEMGVDVKLNTTVQSYDGLQIRTSKDTFLQAKTVIWSAGVKGNVPEGLNKDIITKGNRILVDANSKINGYNNIYAIGDIAAMILEDFPSGHPMVAQAAIQQGNLLAKNLIQSLKKNNLQNFDYRDKGSLATVGKRKAVADLGKFKFGGFIAWLLWSLVHLVSISGFKNKLSVGFSWAWSYFTYDKGNRLIIRKYNVLNDNIKESKQI